jgi:adenosylhomocysteine nucleosidase
MQTNIIVITALDMELEAKNLPAGIGIYYSGIGKINAAIATMQAIERSQPKLIINFGTAGAVHHQTSGLLPIRRVVQRDMIAEPLAPRGQAPFCTRPYEYFSKSGEFSCGTGDSFVTSQDPWLVEQDITVVDMELFAIAAVAHEHQIEWLSYKYVTDHANESSVEDWSAKVNHGEQLFLEQLKEIVKA